MARDEPAQLEALVREHILNVKQPRQLPLHRPKQRRKRARTASYGQAQFTPAERKMLLKHARATRDRRRVRQLLREQLLRLQDQLCRSVLRGRVNHDLWAKFVEATTGALPR
jgi:hypothetical protein